MTTSYDVIVLGLGGMGSAAAAQLARRGQRVLGLEQFALGHDRGSSHGESRLIREAYFESPRYVPLVRRAYQLWDQLGEEHGGALLHRVGLAMCAPQAGAQGRAFARTRQTARELGVALEELDAAEVRARFPALQLPDGFACLFEPGAGFLEVERCVAAQLATARRGGAELRDAEPVRRWRATADGVHVETARGSYAAGQLVIAAGAWSRQVLAELRLPLRVHRVMQLWFGAGEAMARSAGMPCFAFDLPEQFCYGFPRWGPWGCKICAHAPGEAIDGEQLDAGDAQRLAEVDRSLRPADVAAVAEVIARFLPEVDAAPVHSQSCLYTMTPDEDFIVDTHPAHRNVHLAAGFSGHGFKFAAAIGELLADLACGAPRDAASEFLRLRWG